MERPGAKEVVLKAAQTLGSRGGAKRPAAEVLKSLLASLDRSKSFDSAARVQRRCRGSGAGDAQPEG